MEPRRDQPKAFWQVSLPFSAFDDGLPYTLIGLVCGRGVDWEEDTANPHVLVDGDRLARTLQLGGMRLHDRGAQNERWTFTTRLAEGLPDGL